MNHNDIALKIDAEQKEVAREPSQDYEQEFLNAIQREMIIYSPERCKVVNDIAKKWEYQIQKQEEK